MKGESVEKKERPACPYCEEKIVTAEFPYCKPCEVSLLYCANCRISVVREATCCPECGGELEWR
ncbi:MAG: hypothetical protein WC749_16645 [Dehalococcoidia bacterium]